MVGCDGVPQVLGVDASGREVLSYVDGQTIGAGPDWPAWASSEAALVQVGQCMRRLHDATAAFVPDPGLTWFAGQKWRPSLVVGHHDATPWNAVWRDDRLVGFVDWDTAGPSSREYDLALSALTWVPLSARNEGTGMQPGTVAGRSRRLRLLLDAYGTTGTGRRSGAWSPLGHGPTPR
jgi:Ser/Thr protein kinase RdoA (MazF antagonist)